MRKSSFQGICYYELESAVIPTFIPSEHLVTSVRVVENGGHDAVTVFTRGANAGTFIVNRGDGERVAERLLRVSPWAPGEAEALLDQALQLLDRVSNGAYLRVESSVLLDKIRVHLSGVTKTTDIVMPGGQTSNVPASMIQDPAREGVTKTVDTVTPCGPSVVEPAPENPAKPHVRSDADDLLGIAIFGFPGSGLL